MRINGGGTHDSTIETEIKEAMPDQNPAATELQAGPNPTLLNNIQLFSRYAPTLNATGYAVLGATIVPAFVCFIIWQLSPAYQVGTLRGSVVRSLWCSIPIFFFALTLARMLRAGGAAENHFGWSPILCDGLLKTVYKLILFCIPLKLLYTALETFEGGIYYESLGRIFFVASMIFLMVGLLQTGKAIDRWLEPDNTDEHWTGFLRKILLKVVAFCPLGLGLMAVAGFHFTAVQLSWRTVLTIVVTIGIAVSTGLVSRLLLITQFRIKLRQLNRNSEGEIEEDESIDISEITCQVNRLLRVTALVALVMISWQIWSTVLPAIGYLDQVHLWPNELADKGVKSWITLRHLLMAFAVLSITFVLSRNLPGLLEITLLDRLPLDKGGRYAISFVLRYVVGILGTLSAFQIVGFSWNSVQWLAAGLTVGLGFGLQEIFANLVSGIIILIERPVRVGDLVTVNGVTGTVTQMQLRATTIKDLDYRELIVPNKKFITEDVMNWTLTDRLSRLVFPVGIAYGSDTQLAEDTLIEVARKHPLVMHDPKPTVLFKSFGDSTLNFELRVVIPTREKFADVQHELNMAIDRAFREKNIEIAFPQQDIHVKGIEPIQIQPPPTTGRPMETTQSSIIPPLPNQLGPNDISGAVFAKASRSGKASQPPEVSFKRRAA